MNYIITGIDFIKYVNMGMDENPVSLTYTLKINFILCINFAVRYSHSSSVFKKSSKEPT